MPDPPNDRTEFGAVVAPQARQGPRNVNKLMARVFYMGAPSGVNLPAGTPPGAAIKATSNNTGNLLIGNALKRHLKAETFNTRLALGPDYVSQNFDYIVIGASNFLFRNFDFGAWADFLEKTRLPCTIIGLGAQAPRYGDRLEIPAGTRRLIQIIAERSCSLGVRGEWTASVLAQFGIKNVRVIGCPAMYWTCQPSLELNPLTDKRPLRVAVNNAVVGNEHAADPESARRVNRELGRLAFQQRYPCILQNATVVAEIADGRSPLPDLPTIRALGERYGVGELTPEAFVQFLKSQTRIYFDVEEWRSAMRQFDFVLGTRFHGCLIALLAGVPAFIFTHDARTRELCELLRLPHRSVEETGAINVELLYRSLDLERLQVRYRELFENYRRFLEENRVEHTLPGDSAGSGLQALSRSGSSPGGTCAEGDHSPRGNP